MMHIFDFIAHMYVVFADTRAHAHSDCKIDDLNQFVFILNKTEYDSIFCYAYQPT